jgi:D-tyrosyl-tRNA(Tyr) deacylase
MKIVLQRVKSANVAVEGKPISAIGQGLVLLVGIANGDTEGDARYLAEKCVNLRIFEDDHGKMNISGLDVGAEILAISQFTLYGDTRRGRRPSFTGAAPPDQSKPLFDQFIKILRESGLQIRTGQFGAYMQVSLVNDGPVTIILDSNDKKQK